MFDKKQFKDLIERTLKEVDLYSEASVNLLLGTAAQESKFGTYLKQLGSGPAVGPFQMEPATEFDCWNNYLKYHKDLIDKISVSCGVTFSHPEQLEYNLKYAIIMTRIRYLRVPKPLPDKDDIRGLANYWKQYYNTPLGQGTVSEFVSNYSKYVLS